LSLSFVSHQAPLGLIEKILSINWGLVLLLSLISGIGFAVLYSAANGSLDPWALKSMIRFAVALALMLVVAVIDIRLWYRAAYPIYVLAVLLLVLVDVKGVRGLGAQRWLELGPLSLQPSEIMKVGLVMVLAHYFNSRTHEEIGRPLHLVFPTLLVLIPAALVMKQPDLGTAMMLLLCGGGIFFIAGVRLWKFILVAAGGGALVPIAWQFMRPYQKNRIYTFMNPE
jgi:rod shape determining protein RodA